MKIRKVSQILYLVIIGLFLLDIITTTIGLQMGFSEAGKLSQILWEIYGYIGGTYWWFVSVAGLASNFLLISMSENPFFNKIGDGCLFGLCCVWVWAVSNNTILIILQSIETLL